MCLHACPHAPCGMHAARGMHAMLAPASRPPTQPPTHPELRTPSNLCRYSRVWLACRQATHPHSSRSRQPVRSSQRQRQQQRLGPQPGLPRPQQRPPARLSSPSAAPPHPPPCLPQPAAGRRRSARRPLAVAAAPTWGAQAPTQCSRRPQPSSSHRSSPPRARDRRRLPSPRPTSVILMERKSPSW